jgi:signal transduction histidine kinase/CheY-like chemotaxis protein
VRAARFELFAQMRKSYGEAAMTNPQVKRRMHGTTEILRALRALKMGDFDFRMSVDPGATDGEIAGLFNEIVEMNVAMAAELARLRDQVGKKGQIDRRASIDGATGSWAQCMESINALVGDLVHPASDSLSGKQREDLQRTNEKLQEKARQLSEQMKQVEYRNKQIEAARTALEHKAEQLALGSRYKSEFLANMSHELRTPLNSLLILAQLLAENASGNLTPKQVEFAQTICISGNDLLALINDVLDLSKVESGTVTLSISSQSLAELRDYVERAFRQVAHDRGLEFSITLEKGLPATILTDMKRLRQIIQNLLSNAFKFTLQGEVSLGISVAGSGWTPGRSSLDDSEQVVAFSVVDTGIGIRKDKQKIIFEAFRQADGTTSRMFEGTGLGLSISSELARLLGGEIGVESSLGNGSTFTLYLPLNYRHDAATEEKVLKAHAQAGEEKAGQGLGASVPADEPVDQRDDRERIRPGDRVVLNVAGDAKFGALLLRQVRELGFRALSAPNVHTALALANEYMPNVVTAYINSRDTGGWALFNLLKRDPDTRHIPVNVICIDDQKHTYACMFALGLVSRPSREEVMREALRTLGRFMEHAPRSLLVAVEDKAERETMVEAMSADGLQVTGTGTGKQVLKVLGKAGIDCTLIGHSLADMAPTDLVREIVQTESIDHAFIVIHTAVGGDGTNQSGEGRDLGELLWLKRVQSTEAVLEAMQLCLHQAMKEMPPGHRRPSSSLRELVPALTGSKVLVVDDDIRNIFALTSALEQQGMLVLNAESSVNGIAMLKTNPDVDVILMDMMMPGQDGYQAIRAIRGMEQFRKVPIIGVSAKAMYGDREKCMEAGATDYIAKPVNVEQLLSVMRMWLGD